jgi:hypothetical protein
VTFIGRFDGFAAWLLERASLASELPVTGAVCGLKPDRWNAAILDSYDLEPNEICALAQDLPIATLGEAKRCETEGILIDYHVDRMNERPTARLLLGPAYAPLDPAFAGRGRAGEEVGDVLITVGGSEQALSYVPRLEELVRRAFPGARLIVPRGGPTTASPVRVLDLVERVDLAVSAAGFTAYELACAGVPQVVVAIVANQRRVVGGMRTAGLGACVDLCAGERLDMVGSALERLRDLESRRTLSERGRSVFDGRGATRAAEALLERWFPAATMHAPADGRQRSVVPRSAAL